MVVCASVGEEGGKQGRDGYLVGHGLSRREGAREGADCRREIKKTPFNRKLKVPKA